MPATRRTPAPCSSSSSTARRSRCERAVRRGRAATAAPTAPSRSRIAAGRRRARAVLEGPQGGVRGRGPDQPRLLRPGRRHPAHAAARGARAIDELSAEARAARGQRLPRRRRQPAPAVLFDDARGRARRERAEELAGRDPRRSASSSAARSPASTASASDKAKYMPRHVQRRRPRHVAAPALRLRPGRRSPTRARSCRRRGCAARCPAVTGRPPAGRGRDRGGLLMADVLEDLRAAATVRPARPPSRHRRRCAGALGRAPGHHRARPRR